MCLDFARHERLMDGSQNPNPRLHSGLAQHQLTHRPHQRIRPVRRPSRPLIATANQQTAHLVLQFGKSPAMQRPSCLIKRRHRLGPCRLSPRCVHQPHGKGKVRRPQHAFHHRPAIIRLGHHPVGAVHPRRFGYGTRPTLGRTARDAGIRHNIGPPIRAERYRHDPASIAMRARWRIDPNHHPPHRRRRAHPPPLDHVTGPKRALNLLDQLSVELERSLDGNRENAELAAKVRENFDRYRVLAERDRSNIARLTRELDSSWVIEVPYLDEDVHDLGGLAEINRFLFSSHEERMAILEGAAV